MRWVSREYRSGPGLAPHARMPNRKHTTVDHTARSPVSLEHIAAGLAALREQDELRAVQIADLEEQLLRARARGTREITPIDRPAWYVGDDGPTPELHDAIAGFLATRAGTLHDIVVATGARKDRVSGALVEMRRQKRPLVNIGNGHRAVYYYVTPDAVARATGSQTPEAG